MRKTLIVVSACLLCALAPTSAFAWGNVGHRLIMRRAIDLLPPELKEFFTANREEIAVRSIDPDTWRLIPWETEDPNHFVDFGMPELGPYPFKELPRDYDAAVQKFGLPMLRRIGLAPWREAEQFGNLRRGFESIKRGSPYFASDLILFSAITGHYIQDIHQPFHATNNYDGQMTGQAGLHARFETELVERFVDRLALTPAAPAPITNPRDVMFDAALASYQLVEQVLAADKAAVAGKDVYDDEYYEKFFAAVKPILERRLSDSITATAGVIIGAWEAAGKPAIPTKVPKPVQKVRR